MKIKYPILALGLLWITINVYFLPFFAWTTGIVRSWLMLQGYIPYRDFTWLRTPLDLLLLTTWFRFFGTGANSYQNFVYVLLIISAILVFFVGWRFLPKMKLVPFLFYIIFLYPLFQNTEMGELLVGIWGLLLLFILFSYFERRENYWLILSGITSGLSLITKQNSGGVIPAVFGIILIDAYIQKQLLLSWIKRCSYFFLGLSVPISGLIAYFALNKSLGDLFRYTIGYVLGSYRKSPLPPGYSLGDALWIEAAYFILLVPLLLFRKEIKLTWQKTIFLLLLVLAFVPSLLPSLLSYRAFTTFPVITIAIGYNLFIFIEIYKKRQKLLPPKLIILVLSFFLSLVLVQRFLGAYVSSIRDEGVGFGKMIKDYGDSEYQAAEWIKNNTKENDKIMSFSSTIVYFLSNRLPTNKYLDPFPYLLYPYDESAGVFIDNPPRVFVFEETLLQDFPDLASWPFYKYLQKEYLLRARFGVLSIYQLPQKSSSL